jgi:hypothetical protein
LTRRRPRLPSPRPVRRGCFREALLKQGGMRRPASLCMHTVAREAIERHRPAATTSGTCERSNVTSKGTAHDGKRRKNVRFKPKPMIAFKNISYAPILHPTLAVKERSRWPAAVERREASVPRRADGESLPARGRVRTTRVVRAQPRVPPHPGACRRSASLVREGHLAKLGGDMPRENDDVCPYHLAVIARPAGPKQSSSGAKRDCSSFWIASSLRSSQ